MKPTVGRIVHYTVSEMVAQMITKRREDFTIHRARDIYQDTGYIAHFGNPIEAGEVLPLLIIKVWPDGRVNGQVFLDGNDTIWVTSLSEGEGPGFWSWPPRV